MSYFNLLQVDFSLPPTGSNTFHIFGISYIEGAFSRTSTLRFLLRTSRVMRARSLQGKLTGLNNLASERETGQTFDRNNGNSELVYTQGPDS